MKQLSDSITENKYQNTGKNQEKRVRAFYLYEEQLQELEKTDSPSQRLRNILEHVFRGGEFE